MKTLGILLLILGGILLLIGVIVDSVKSKYRDVNAVISMAGVVSLYLGHKILSAYP